LFIEILAGDPNTRVHIQFGCLMTTGLIRYTVL